VVYPIVRLTLRQSRPNEAGLKCLSVLCTYVHASTESLFDFSEIQSVGKGRRVMQDGMQYEPIQGQGNKPFKLQSWKSGRFQKLSPPQCTTGAGN